MVVESFLDLKVGRWMRVPSGPLLVTELALWDKPNAGEPSRRVAAVAWQGVVRACMEPPPVQILVVVANTQLRTEVGEGFHVNSIFTWVSRFLANGVIRAKRDFTSHAMDER
ncbi:hypothetical protein NPIL_388791 [Nephila pilipes]|uniref:Uncharacterized protein n=1 Tax=Nephila pilipes TaxID=299642 RepID=A0A8X6T3G2_NEPPI|nr:hypothetical protein NPIL_388791 [Nephila pilipes]